jgi:nucleotide-binding universal stress UspA family protein
MMPDPIRTMVVGVASMDDQDPRTPGGADPVLGPAVQLAAALGAELHAVHAFEVPEGLSWAGGGGTAGTAPVDRAAAWEPRLEERLDRQLAGIPGGDAAHCRAVEGPAAEVLCRTVAEVEADLLVVGVSRRGRAWAGILGSTASQVIATSDVPVLVVHRPFAPGPPRVLLTSDLSPAAQEEVSRAIPVARQVLGEAAELRCLHVVDLDPLIAPSVADDVLEAIAAARLDRSLGSLDFAPIVVERRVRVGDAAREITLEASEWGAGLLVVGTGGHGGAGARRVGHVAAAAVRGAACNVLVIPAPDRIRPAGPAPRLQARSGVLGVAAPPHVLASTP